MDSLPSDSPRPPRSPLAAVLQRRWPRALLGLVLVGLGAAIVPRLLCGRGAAALLDGDLATQDEFARAVIAQVEAGVGPDAFHTGSARFDGEWAYGTHQMALLGLGQIVLAHPDHPERRAAYLPAMRTCAARLIAPDGTAFGTAAWRERGLDHLAPDDDARGHAYLGYLDLALGVLRLVEPDNAFAPVHDRLTAALTRRLDAAPHGVFETYPGESYPADIAAVAGAIALHDRAVTRAASQATARGTSVVPSTDDHDHRALLHRWRARFRARAVDPSSGLLYQALDAASGRPTAPPRASGTAFAVYSLSFVDPDLSRDLWRALTRRRARLLGFGALREYPPGHAGAGDIDSGPVVLGLGLSASGFGLAGARVHGDREAFTELYRTAVLFGVPVARGGGERRFLAGGPIGNAILLAMTTALPSIDATSAPAPGVNR